MMRFYQRWLDNAISGLGYTKTSGQPIEVIFAGEAPVGAGMAGIGDEHGDKYERMAITSAWVFSDIDTIAKKVAQSSLNVFRKSGEGEVAETDHEFERLMINPTGQTAGRPGWSGALLLRYTAWWWLLRGEAYWMKGFDAGGDLAQLWPIPSSRMDPIPDPTTFIKGYKYTPAQGQAPITLLPEQVVYFRFPNPFDYHRGLSPLTGYRLALETDVAASKWNRDTFTKEATLKTLFSLPAELSKPLYEAAKREILDELLESQRRFLIARAGAINVKEFGLNHKDLDFLGGREFTREEIDRVFGFPAGYWAKEATRANSEGAEAALINNTIWPLMCLMHGDVTAQVVQPHYGADLVARFTDIRIRDRQLQLDEYRTTWQVKTVDEARKDLGLEALSDIETGGKLVPVATKAPVAPGFSGTPGESGGLPVAVRSLELSGNGDGHGPDLKAISDDLKRWESIERRRIKHGELSGYDFQSDVVPATTRATILEALKTATDEAGVRSAFAAPFRPDHWQGYP